MYYYSPYFTLFRGGYNRSITKPKIRTRANCIRRIPTKVWCKNTQRNTQRIPTQMRQKGDKHMRKYKLRCAYCGSTIHKYETLLKLHFILHNSYTLNCPICHKKSRWITHFTLKHDQDKKERHFNKGKLFDDRI